MKNIQSKKWDYHYQWIRVLLLTCNTFDELKEQWSKLQEPINKKLTSLERFLIIHYKNKRKKELENGSKTVSTN